MTKRKGHFIYFTEADARILTKLANGRNESKSAVVRKLIQIAKYKDTLVEIENHNKLLKDFFKRICSYRDKYKSNSLPSKCEYNQ